MPWSVRVSKPSDVLRARPYFPSTESAVDVEKMLNANMTSIQGGLTASIEGERRYIMMSGPSAKLRPMSEIKVGHQSSGTNLWTQFLHGLSLFSRMD